MDGRAIAYSNEAVSFTDGSGQQSSAYFHLKPDGANTFPSDSGGFYYSSNSEVGNGGGGVGVIEFDANGEVIDYYQTLVGTNRNCGGGPTPWKTWISCEESGHTGRVWQTDPSGARSAEQTNVVAFGGNYESFAFDDRYEIPRFFVTEDSSDGALVRYTPGPAGMACYNQTKDEDRWCTLHEAGGTYEYLRITAGNSGTFTWTSSKYSANPNRYKNAEGIDVVNGILIFVSKVRRALFELDLDAGTFTRSSTVSGAFNNAPDQLEILVGGDVNGDSVSDDEDIMFYFCEDGGEHCDIHGRSLGTDKYFTIVEGTGYNGETTGLAFSPDARYMFVSFQHQGVIWQFWRTDGYSFHSQRLDIKYHDGTIGNRRLGGDHRRLNEARTRLGAPRRNG